MSHLALARKWRPRKFDELKGQEHVVTALSNALDRGRLHHAYLLTGTRGVGKTTIARILAKSLNCVNGVSARPCGICPACTDIDAGRFVDLLELDAASNTGVDNMREILDNARYAPTLGRYKVYLIDEVHMLSKGAFNSMLKTLEEPPEHVKFVLATTDPQKIPVTVLSRCLQFNLKPLPHPDIAARIETILDAEGITRDAGSVGLIARAAKGSLRDALSLLDQAIAYGSGALSESVVRTMLGTVDRDYAYRIVAALVAGDGPALMAESDGLNARGLSAAAALDELASLFHRIAVAQAVPDAARSFDEAERIASYAQGMSAESIQLAYQISAQGRADLAIAPDEGTGFAMTLLRLLAFEPATAVSRETPPSEPPRKSVPGAVSTLGSVRAARSPPEVASQIAAATAAKGSADHHALPSSPKEWTAFVSALKLNGMAAQLAAQSELRGVAGNVVNLALPATHKHLADRAYSDKLKSALEAACGRKLMLAFEVGEATPASKASTERKAKDEVRERTEAAFRDEPFVRDLVDRFDAKVRAESIQPLVNPESPS